MGEIPSFKNLALPLILVGSLFIAQLQRAQEKVPTRLYAGEIMGTTFNIKTIHPTESDISLIIKALDDVNELRALGALLMKQNACQSHVLRHSLIKIAELEKRIKTLQARVTTLMKLKFRFLQPLKSILNRNP